MVRRREVVVQVVDSLEQAKKVIEVETKSKAELGLTPIFTHTLMFVTGKLKKRWRENNTEFEEETFDAKFFVMLIFEEVNNDGRRLGLNGIHKS